MYIIAACPPDGGQFETEYCGDERYESLSACTRAIQWLADESGDDWDGWMFEVWMDTDGNYAPCMDSPLFICQGM